jgi:hypothetical protein
MLSQSWDSFEINPNGTPYWVASGFEPNAGMNGFTLTRILLLNAVTGSITSIAPGANVPQWVNQAVPASIATQWSEWYGRYRHGWGPASPFGTKAGVYQVVSDSIKSGQNAKSIPSTVAVMGNNGDLWWYTGLTSLIGNDQSLVAYTWIDARTGQSFYHVEPTGIMNSSAAMRKVDGAFPNATLTAKQPLYIDIYGQDMFVMPVVNSSDKLQDFAFVDPTQPNAPPITASSWSSAISALQEYIANEAATGSGLTTAVKDITITGKIARIGQYASGRYAFTVEGSKLIFAVDTSSFPTAAIAQTGDSVTVIYVQTPGVSQSVVPVSSFSDTSA